MSKTIKVPRTELEDIRAKAYAIYALCRGEEQKLGSEIFGIVNNLLRPTEPDEHREFILTRIRSLADRLGADTAGAEIAKICDSELP